MSRRLSLPAAARRTRRTAAVAAVVALAGIATPATVALLPTAAQAGTPCALPADTVAPQLANLVLSPTSVDVSRTGQNIGVSVDATDTSATGVGSGVDGILVVVMGPNGRESFGSAAELRRVSGSATDGTWKGRMRLPRYAPDGSYHVVLAAAFDVDGNLQTYAGNNNFFFFGAGPAFVAPAGAQAMLARVQMQRKEQLSASSTTTPPTHPASSPTDPQIQPGWVTQVQVHSAPRPVSPQSGGGETVHMGTLRDFTIRPETADTRRHARQVRVRAVLSGGQPRLMEAIFDNPMQGPDPQFEIDMRRSGSAFVGSTRVPTWAGNESFHVTLYAVYLTKDGHSRLQAWTPDQLEAAGFSHVVHIESGVDHTRPTLTSLSISPHPIDSSGAAVTASVTARAHDTHSGVRRVFLGLFRRFQPAPDYIEIDELKSVRLDKTGGHWAGSFRVGRCATSGTWMVAAAVIDKAGNVRQYQGAGLSKLGLPGKLKVTSAAGDRTPPAVSGITRRGQHVEVQFSEPVRNVSAANLFLYQMKPRANRYLAPTPIDAITCFDDQGNAEPDCTGATTPVSSAELTVSGLVVPNRYELWANLFSVTPQLTDVAGNPMDWTTVADEFHTT